MSLSVLHGIADSRTPSPVQERECVHSPSVGGSRLYGAGQSKPHWCSVALWPNSTHLRHSLLTPVQGTSSGLSLQGAPFPPKLVSRLLRVGDAGKRKYFRNWKY